MKHLKILIPTATTCALAIIIHMIIIRTTGFDLYGYRALLILPLGAMLIGFLATSGAVLAAFHFRIKPNRIDLAVMLIFAVITAALISILDYTAAMTGPAYKLGGSVDLKSSIDLVLTSRLGVKPDGENIARFAEAAYDLAGLQFIGLVTGGALGLLLIKGLRKCERCDGYVRKLRTTTTPTLNFQETTELLDMFDRGDLTLLQKIVAWRPDGAAFDAKFEQATITYDLYSCAHCNSETLSLSVRTLSGKKWKNVPSLSSRRHFMADSPLRHAFP